MMKGGGGTGGGGGSNYVLNGFSEGLPLFKLIFFKIKKYFNKNWYFMCENLTPESYTHPPTCIDFMQTMGIFNMWVTPNQN